jgi:hypothetical protein
MAGFRTHIAVSSALGVGYAGALHTMYGVPLPAATLAGTLCGVAGMLPDLDSDYGTPLREAMCFAAATIPLLLVHRFETLRLDRNTIILVSICLYLFVRFVVANMIRKYTVHRGMFHSIPAMLTFGGITYLLTGGSPTNERYMMAGGVMAGFFSHLLLDEIYSVEFKTGRWRTKKSFGSAMKLWGGNSKSNFTAYAKLAVVGMGVVGEPNALKNFVSSQPELMNKLNDAINVLGTVGQNDPNLAKEVDQLKDILGTLNQNTAGGYAPQNGGGWPTAQTSPTAVPNSQYPYSPSANSSAAPNQYSPYPSLPPQQLPSVAPTTNHPSNWQWPGANQSYGNSQPASLENGYNTAQRPGTQYTQ